MWRRRVRCEGVRVVRRWGGGLVRETVRGCLAALEEAGIHLQGDCIWLGWDIFRGEIIIGGCGLLLGNSL